MKPRPAKAKAPAARARKRAQPLDAAQEEALEASVAEVKDEGLKAELLRLGRAVLAEEDGLEQVLQGRNPVTAPHS